MLKGVKATLFAQTNVVMGSGKAIVTAVGVNTKAGQLQCDGEQDEKEQTPLQNKLTKIADQIGKLGFACAFLTLFALVIRMVLESLKVLPCGCTNIMTCEADDSCVPYSFSKRRLWVDLMNTTIICISIIVCAIPEGLPLAVTIA